jgi:hypothetical protein
VLAFHLCNPDSTLIDLDAQQNSFGWLGQHTELTTPRPPALALKMRSSKEFSATISELREQFNTAGCT